MWTECRGTKLFDSEQISGWFGVRGLVLVWSGYGTVYSAGTTLSGQMVEIRQKESLPGCLRARNYFQVVPMASGLPISHEMGING